MTQIVLENLQHFSVLCINSVNFTFDWMSSFHWCGVVNWVLNQKYIPLVSLYGFQANVVLCKTATFSQRTAFQINIFLFPILELSNRGRRVPQSELLISCRSVNRHKRDKRWWSYAAPVLQLVISSFHFENSALLIFLKS